MTPGIELSGVWKKFRRGERHDSLRDLVPAAARRLISGRRPDDELQREEFWAVRDISFRVAAGDALGLIGSNGAGKSTVLKLLTRILKPTLGDRHVSGRVGALIEVAAGFHPDLTGRENVYLQGAIMGMRRAEIKARFDQIIDFAGIAEFIDTPVKRYSSGMNARLGFAIAAHLDPDVMIIDEVLSVGDAGFQDKCVKHMQGMIGRGVPVVFVSHNLPAILELCTRVIVINHGRAVFDGTPAESVQHHRRVVAEPPSGAASTNEPIYIERVELMEEDVPSLGVFRSNGDAAIRIHYNAREPVRDPHFTVEIHRDDSVLCYATTTFQHSDFGTLDGRGSVTLHLPRLAILPGCYVLSVGIAREHGQQPYHLQSKAYPFSVASDIRDRGIVSLDHSWTLREGSDVDTLQSEPHLVRSKDS
jgi:lipopolysaccharide transport system ATP-binding protein